MHEVDSEQHHDSSVAQHVSSMADAATKRPAVVSPPDTVPEPRIAAIRQIPWLVFTVIFIATVGLLLVAIKGVISVPGFWTHSSQRGTESVGVLPWSAFFTSPNPLQLIMSDPNIVTIEEFTGIEISLSDFANRRYVPEPNTLTPEADRLSRMILRGDNPAEVDTPIAVSIAQIAQASSRKVNVHPARSIQLSDLKTDDNFVFLGSPLSNPWSALFSDQLDFRFVFENG